MKVNTARSTNVAKLSKFSPPQKSPPRFFFSPSVSPNFFTLFLDSFFGLLCFRFRLTGVSSIILFRARTLVVLRHGVLANWLVECFSLVVPNMLLSKSNIQKLVSQHTRGRYTFQPLWVSDYTVEALYWQMYVITCLLYGWTILSLFTQMACSPEADQLGALPSGWGEYDLFLF